MPCCSWALPCALDLPFVFVLSAPACPTFEMQHQTGIPGGQRIATPALLPNSSPPSTSGRCLPHCTTMFRGKQQQVGQTAWSGVCRANPPTELDTPLVLERNEYRRGVGICLVNRQGLVFAAQ
jgi:hypothetical protein